ncbi:OmpA family protein [Leptospira levettii]|uniref:OmpA family protein n=1 Tax=Leptospira levettii TaxID=2023178 RepID=A0A6H3NH76_9LEPT|nr:OmpA family protein [Leptospira levettii]MCW7474946.1 OmpA family protein [Leptospira levettii]MCW7512678.1 OmpA family protein [Leptospira levettii]MCW7516112.1 OmpA family protein [Leptospira levettii]TGM31165.1 OmpA family protein [Leptospira levettii]TGM75243.1 OmpA family protein [Leptospira levettii]
MHLHKINKILICILLTYTVQYLTLPFPDLLAEEGVIFENPYKKTEKQTDVTQFTIYFTKKSHLIPKQDQVRLQSVADFLYRNRNFEILISAHAVEGKTNKENVLISEKRSLEVERFLLIHSVEPNQIRRLFYGNSKSPNLTKEHEALNRRVEILLQPIG